MSLTRRAALTSASALAAGATAFLNARPARSAEPVRFNSDPFKLGVASGDPTADGFVIWTRLCTNPFEADGGLGEQVISVRWEVAEDAQFKKPVRAGTDIAFPERGHSLHVELTGLNPDRPYWYRFEAGGVRSMPGRTRTLPGVGAPTERFRVAWVSCQHFEQGFFNAYPDMIAWNPDLILHLGDYIYESSFGQQVRRHPNLDPRTLGDYRVHHAVYKLDEGLQLAHRSAPWALIWDDHDVANDYAGLTAANPADQETFPARRAAGYQAWFENLPIARRSLVANGQMRIYQQIIVGDLAQFILLDTRQYRTPRACVDPARWRTTSKVCPENAAPDRTVLGSDQEFWFGTTLDRSPTRWQAIVNPTMFAHVFQKNAEGQYTTYQDGWSSYPAARQAILDRIVRRGKQDVIMLGGDMHSFIANDVRAKSEGMADSPVVASEFISGSITTHNYNYDRWVKTFAEPGNEHIKFFDDRVHGWGACDIGRDQWNVEFRAVSSTWTRTPEVSTLARFAVQHGRAGLQKL